MSTPRSEAAACITIPHTLQSIFVSTALCFSQSSKPSWYCSQFFPNVMFLRMNKHSFSKYNMICYICSNPMHWSKENTVPIWWDGINSHWRPDWNYKFDGWDTFILQLEFIAQRTTQNFWDWYEFLYANGKAHCSRSRQLTYKTTGLTQFLQHPS